MKKESKSPQEIEVNSVFNFVKKNTFVSYGTFLLSIYLSILKGYIYKIYKCIKEQNTPIPTGISC